MSLRFGRDGAADEAADEPGVPDAMAQRDAAPASVRFWARGAAGRGSGRAWVLDVVAQRDVAPDEPGVQDAVPVWFLELGEVLRASRGRSAPASG